MSKSESLRSDRSQRRALTYRETAESLGICERTVWGLVRNGELRAIRFGRSVRIPIAELERFVSATATAEPESGVSNV